jgi:DtxR family Mn-dependent transcriptional regulator
MPTSTVEDYLKTILLEEPPGPEERVPMGQIAVSLGVAPGTVTAMMKTLGDSGLVDYEPRGGVRLTPAGRQLATHVLRRHRLIELFLVEVVGLDWSEVHGEAELLEHAVSERLIERIDQLLGNPSVDPHGDPIPSRSGKVETREHPSLLGCPTGTPLRVVRVTDQSAEFLRLVERSRLRPGSRLTVTARDEAADTVELRLDGGLSLSLGQRAASKILVEPARKR